MPSRTCLAGLIAPKGGSEDSAPSLNVNFWDLTWLRGAARPSETAGLDQEQLSGKKKEVESNRIESNRIIAQDFSGEPVR